MHTMKHGIRFFAFIILLIFASSVDAQSVLEGFDNVPVIFQSGWEQKNRSSPQGPGTWKQDYGNFTHNNQTEPPSGGDSSAIVCSYESTDPNGTGTISNWLFSPVLNMNPGDTVWFYTISYRNDIYADRMEVRMSTNGTSTEVGSTSTSVGDFDSLLLSINPDLENGNAYPIVWKKYGLPVPVTSANVSGRIAFRYYVTDGGGEGQNSSVIGIDDFFYASVSDVGVEEEMVSTIVIYPNPSSTYVKVQATTSSSINRIEVLDVQGKRTVISVNQPAYQLQVEDWAQGIYLLHVYWEGVQRPSVHKLIVQ